MMNIFSNQSEESKIEEISALHKTYSNPAQRLDFLYGNLSILDAKASSLLTFNAIGLTALAVWLQYIPPNWLHFTLDIVFIIFLLSCVCCLITVWIYWSQPNDLIDSERLTRMLLDMRNTRTRLYRLSWVLAMTAVGVLTIVSAFHSFGTFCRASGILAEKCQITFSESNWGNREIEKPVTNEVKPQRFESTSPAVNSTK